MTPLPKRRTSKARSARRRSHLALTAANLTVCPDCQSAKLPHRACPNCGTYHGRKVVQTESES